MTNIGILFTQTHGYFFNYGAMWRFTLGTAAIVAVIHFLGLLGLVESHEWLGTKGQKQAATAILNRIRGGHLSPEEVLKWGEGEPDTEERELLLAPSLPTAARDSKQQEPLGILAVMRHPDHWRAVVAVIAVMFAQQFCGINSVMMYSVSFLSEVMPTAAGLITIAVGGVNLVVTMAGAPLADKLGRKASLLLSIAGMGISSVLLGFGIMYAQQVLTGVATLLFVASFALGLGPVPFIMASELVGPEVVAETQSLALAANWSSTFGVAQFFPMLNAAMGRGQVFFIFAALALVFFLFISWWVPESKGKANADEVWGRVRRED
jgi:MFS family permease